MTEASGEAEAITADSETSTGATVKTGYLEASGVDLSQEMVKMIEASKAFSLGSKVIQAADEMEKVVNQLR